ncbi:6976_t:CDS:10 [Ambispora leptoticha]|uniref:6976_t:CDS:1 n=1 Tax=Ambispora leptoticha TaxID=144679 RepID=A0A9N8VL19_9GLOM|nr:6976_t:CDS:10 [Ambispora leptoticha]
MSRVLSEKTENFTSDNDNTKDFVTRVLSPRIAIVSSQDADTACRKNNFTNFFEFIRPFGERYEGKITVRDSQGLSNTIEGFTFRFADLACLEQPDNQIIAKLLADKVKSNCGDPKQQNEFPPISSKADVTEKYLTVSQDDITPWYAEYRRLFFQLTGVSEHETFEHPVACIIVVSSLDSDPLNQFAQLFDDNMPAPIYEKGFMDPNILKYYVLLHDNHKASLEHSEAIFDQMKRKFGLNCYLLKLNSIPLPTIPDNNDPFSQPPTSPMKPSSNPDIWTSSIKETSLRSLIMSANSVNTEKHTRSDSLSSIQTNTLPLSPTASSLNSPTSSLSEDILFLAKEKEANALESQNITGLVGNLPSPVVIYGQYLSEEDFAGIQFFIRELIEQSLIHWMGRNILLWNEQVASSRRGITGRLFSASRRYFGTGGKSGQLPSTQQSSNSTGGPQNAIANTIYPHTSPEAQMRKLADYAFMLRDYRLAHSVYDTIKKDFSADKAWKHYAGAQEMIGLCLLMSTSLIGSKTDVDHYFEQSVNAFYNRVKSPFFATKATILYYEMLKHRKMYKDAPIALVRMSGEDSDLRSALFLEQAAHAFLRYPRPMVRKYAFHLVMAGHRYGKCNQREHAYRCYLSASHVFENRSWSLVEDHIHFALGRQSFHMGDLDNSLHFFLKLLRASRQPASQQSAYLKEFLYIYKHYTSKTGKEPIFNPPDLPIPVILDATIRVVLSKAQSSEYDEIWQKMEQDFVDEKYKNVDAFGRNRLNSAALTKDGHQTVCAVAESFYVQFDIYNPMQIPINITELILECDYIPSTKDSVNSNPNDENTESTDNDSEAFDLETIPEISLNSIVRSRKTFAKRGKRLNNTKQQMMDVVYASDRSLEVLVTSPMPLLEVAFHSFPETLLSGEVMRVVLEINNKGQTGLTDLQVKMSHPSFFCVGDAEMLEKTVYGDNPEFPSSESSLEKLKISNHLFNSSINSIPLPIAEDNAHDSKSLLAPGKMTLIPIWIRGDRIGKHMFRFFFTYQSEDPNAAMKYRSLRYFVTTHVSPSLKINAFTRPSTRGLNEFILGIETENLQTTADFQLLQLSSSSPSWSISPINIITGDDQNSKILIAPRQTTFTYYRISKSQIESPADQLTPEQYALNALERILSSKDESKTPEPPSMELIVTNLPFTSRVIKSSAKPLERFFLNSRVQWRLNSLSNQFPALTQKQHEEIFTLYTTNDIDLVIYWNIPSSQRQGHHYIIGINLGVQQNPFQGKEILAFAASAPNRALFEQTARERAILVNSLLKNKHFKDESPLKILLKCEDKYTHNFVSENLCVLPIKIVLKNCSWNKRVCFNLELLPFDENPNLRSTTAHKSLHTNIFHWTGETYKCGLLSPNDELEFEVKACFTQPGIYDINRWRLTVNMNYDSTVNTATTTGETGEEEGAMISNAAAADSVKGGYIQMPNAPHLLTLLNA